MSKLQNRKICDAAATRLFGFKPPEQEGQRPQPYDAREFQARFGIDVTRLTNFYAETAQADAPIGPLTPASERIPVKPILAIRQEPDGTYAIDGLQMTVGFFSRDKSRAWVPVDEFLELVGDTYYEDMEAELAAEREEILRQIKVLREADLTEEQTEVWQRVRAGIQFEDLSDDERGTIVDIMRMLREKDQ